MHGRRDKNALAELCRQLEDGFINQIARVFVAQAVFAAARGDGERVRQQHIVNFIGVHTRRVDDGARFDLALFGFENIEVVFAADILHAALKFEFNAVFLGVFGKAQGQFKRAYDAGGRTEQRRDDRVAERRLHFSRFVAGKNFEVFYSVYHTALIKLIQRRHVVFVKAQHKRAVSAERNIQFFRDLRHHAVAEDVHLGFQRARFGIKAAVHDGAVRL